MLLILAWATGFTPKAWKTSNTILIDKNKGNETEVSLYCSFCLANALYKLWTCLIITNTLYQYTETHSILSTIQAGFRKLTYLETIELSAKFTNYKSNPIQSNYKS
jgi:hypothetical protein